MLSRASLARTPGDYLFIEPMEWMADMQKPAGQLRCPGCELVLGNFDWKGSDCSCGARMTPAFRISMGLVLTRERPSTAPSSNKGAVRYHTDKEAANSGTPLNAVSHTHSFPSPPSQSNVVQSS